MKSMRHLMMALGIGLAACGGGSGGGGGWDQKVVDEFAQAICTSICIPDEFEAECLRDITADLADAREVLPDALEDECMACLRIKTQLISQVEAMGCQSSPALDAMVLAVCDTDPANDDDGDGDPTNDFNEACAGFP
jgi:hypothetical protein